MEGQNSDTESLIDGSHISISDMGGMNGMGGGHNPGGMNGMRGGHNPGGMNGMRGGHNPRGMNGMGKSPDTEEAGEEDSKHGRPSQ